MYQKSSRGVRSGRRVRQSHRHLWADCLENVGASTSHQHYGPQRPVRGIALPFFPPFHKPGSTWRDHFQWRWNRACRFDPSRWRPLRIRRSLVASRSLIPRRTMISRRRRCFLAVCHWIVLSGWSQWNVTEKLYGKVVRNYSRTAQPVSATDQTCYRVPPSGIPRHVARWKSTDVSEEHIDSIDRVE
jgi:hypothetical protein